MLMALANGIINVDWWSLICTVLMFRGGEQQVPFYYIGRKTRANQNEKKNLHVNQNVHNNILCISVQEDYNPGRKYTAIAESDDTKIFIITRTILVLEAVKQYGWALRQLCLLLLLLLLLLLCRWRRGVCSAG